MSAKDWTFAEVWNASLLNADVRPMKEREHMWASELGKAPIDIYLKMHATEPTNPPNARSMRKFEAGNVFEWIVALILKRAGILTDAQKWTAYQYPGLVQVTGKCDFIAGGKPDFAKAVAEMKALEMPEVFVRAAEAMKTYFDKHYPSGLGEKPLEIKSVGSYMFDSLEKRKVGSKIHRLQTKHYLKSEKQEVGNLVYICRDDLRMMEVVLRDDDPVLEKEYKDFITLMSGYLQKSIVPPKEQPILFDDDLGKFATNFNVAYSGYLTLLYGLKDQKEFDDTYKRVVGKWNRVLNRFKQGKKMTAKNIAVIEEIVTAGFDPAVLAGKFEVSEDEEEET